MSDFGILSSPQADARRMRVPVEAQHFEIERSSTPVREKMSRGWNLRKKKEVTRISHRDFPLAVVDRVS